MGRVLATLQTGDWLTRERIRLVAGAVLFASMAGICYLIATSDGRNDYTGRPLGTDFSNVYAAGQLVLEGSPAAAYDPCQHRERERAIFGESTPFYGWLYPPFFLFVAAGLALMPYPVALAVWQGVTLLLYVWSIRAILRAKVSSSGRAYDGTLSQEHNARGKLASAEQGTPDKLWLLLALSFPAVFVNIGHGHNGFLTAALLGGGLVLLDLRPIVAGILFGLLAYKPQFGLMIPLVLAASGRWRTMASATVTIGALTLATLLVFGPEVWNAFLGSGQFTRTIVLEQGGPGWHKLPTVFAWVRMWGGTVPLAYAAQGAISLALAASLMRLWHSRVTFALAAAALALAALLATPYSLDYDMMVLAPAIAFLAADGLARGFAPYEETALAALWLVPLVARAAAEATLIPLGVITMGATFALLLRQARREHSASTRWLSPRDAVR
jgi:alpha-1,2-mannosyltransferase